MGSASSRTGSSAWDTSAQVSVSMGPSRSIRTRRYQSGPSFSKTTSHSRRPIDRKSTRLNSSHVSISYAVFCLKKKKQLNHLVIADLCDCAAKDTYWMMDDHVV